MGRSYPRQSKVTAYIPMPDKDIIGQMRDEGFVLPKRARVHSEVYVQLPFGWSYLPERGVIPGSIIDENGLERYQYHPGDANYRVTIKSVGQRAVWNRQIGNGHVSDQGIRRSTSHVDAVGPISVVRPGSPSAPKSPAGFKFALIALPITRD